MATTGADAAFLDTNILVHASAAGSPLHERAREAMPRAGQAGLEAWISRQVSREYLAVVTRP